MNRLVDDLISKVITFLDLKENYFLCSTHKNCLLVANQHLKQQIQDKKKWVIKWFPDVIHDLMCGLSTLIFAPILSFKNNFMDMFSSFFPFLGSKTIWIYGNFFSKNDKR